MSHLILNIHKRSPSHSQILLLSSLIKLSLKWKNVGLCGSLYGGKILHDKQHSVCTRKSSRHDIAIIRPPIKLWRILVTHMLRMFACGIHHSACRKIGYLGDSANVVAINSLGVVTPINRELLSAEIIGNFVSVLADTDVTKASQCSQILKNHRSLLFYQSILIGHRSTKMFPYSSSSKRRLDRS